MAARRLGAQEVTTVYRRDKPEMPAFRYEYELAKQHGIGFLWRIQPVAVHGNCAVEYLECVRVELGAPDQTGRRQPSPSPGSNFRLPCDMVITSIGAVQAAGSPRPLPRHSTGRRPRVVDAVAEGKRAARGIAAWLEEAGPPSYN